MKKRNLILCGLLSMNMAVGSVVPVMASEDMTQKVSSETKAAQVVTGTTVTAKTTSSETAETETEVASDTSSADSQGSGDQQTPPAKPDGEAADSTGAENGQAPNGDGGTPPELPDGQTPGENGGTPPDGEAPSGQAPDGAPGGQGGPGGQASGVDSYTSVNEYTEDTTLDGDTIESVGTDENAVLVSDAEANVVLNNVTVTRNSADSTGGDNSSFYGVGAALLATAGNLYVHSASVDTDAAGGAGIFAYGDSTVYVSDSTINTKQDTSGGIHAAGGGTLYAWDLTVNTDGESAAAIRSDRGGGTMVVDGGSYTSNGIGSPAIYCTADIAVHNADLTATGSEAVCIEGLNTTRLYDCSLSGSMSDSDQNDCTWNVIVYQSMSGDSEVGNGTFQMSGGTLTAANGGQFYTTNTESTITLSNVNIIPAEENDFFLRCTGNNNARGWGTAGSNGADCLFTGVQQEMEGDVIWDTISNLDFYMTDGSILQGAFVQDDTFSSGEGEGSCNVYVDANSTWTVTGDSTVTSLQSEGTIVDADGATVSIVGTDGTTYVEGNSDYTITCASYSDTADTSAAGVVSEWADYEVEKPAELA